MVPCSACMIPAPGDTNEDHTCGLGDILVDGTGVYEKDDNGEWVPSR